MFALSGAAGGANDALQEIIKQKFLEMVQRQRFAQEQQALEQSALRDQRNFETQGAQIKLGQDRLAQDASEFSAGAPMRAAQLRYVGAQSTDLEGKPQREIEARNFRMKEAETEQAGSLAQIAARGSEERRSIAARGAEDRRTDAAAPKSATAPVANAYMGERNTRVRDAVAALKQKVGHGTAGYGSLLSGIPATGARDFKADLDNLKANIAFGELTEMRAASKTGGALGQVSDKELVLLQSALGALDQGQSPENLKANLDKIEQSLARWEAAKSGQVNTSGAPDVQNMNDAKGRADALLKKYGGG